MREEAGSPVAVAVIAPYQAQISELQDLILPHSPYWRAISIEIATVDAAQGRDYDIALFSTTRSNPQRAIGFLRDRRRLNVALSRAREALIIVGDVATLEEGRVGAEGNPYLEILRHLRTHPEECAIVGATEDDAMCGRGGASRRTGSTGGDR